MRAREFIGESKTGTITRDVGLALPGAFKIPALKNQDPYLQYRFGVAIARARSDAGQQDGVNEHMPEWSPETAFGEHGVVAGMVPSIDKIIDAALAMTLTPGGKKMVSTGPSEIGRAHV